MAKVTYSEPSSYFPPEIRKMFEGENKKKKTVKKTGPKKVVKKGKK